MNDGRTKLLLWSAATLSLIVGVKVLFSAFTKNGRVNKKDEEVASEAGNSNENSLIALAETARSRGNLHYRENRLNEAIQSYTEAIHLYSQNCANIRYAYANRAACYLKKVTIIQYMNRGNCL